MDTTYAGPERRRLDRTVAGRRLIGRARLRPPFTRSMTFHVGQWYPVLEHRPNALLALEDGLPRPGYVWVEVNGKPQEAWAAFLEIEEGAP
jgi:hypothetical protein